MATAIEMKELTTLEEFQRCVDLQKEVWGFDDPYDIVPLPLLVVSQRIDGIIWGAFLKESGVANFQPSNMIGFVYSLPGIVEGAKVQWSHMLAVTAGHQDSNIGYQLKMAQYREAESRGYSFLEWTYDPLESRNAYFNLNKLGCTAHEYEVNVYGYTSSRLHSGTPTDRLIARWNIPLPSKETPPLQGIPEEPVLTTVTKRANQDLLILESIRLKLNEPFLYIEIPSDMQKLKEQSPEEAMRWRMQTRELFLHYLHRGYTVYSFLRFKETPPRSFYVLKRSAIAENHKDTKKH